MFVVHGEDTVTEEFAHTVEEKFGYSAWAPYPCCEADLLKNEIVNEGVRVPVKAKKAARRKSDSALNGLWQQADVCLILFTKMKDFLIKIRQNLKHRSIIFPINGKTKWSA